MRFSTSLVLFAAVVAGTFHVAAVSAAPYNSAESGNPTFPDNPYSLKRTRSKFTRSDPYVYTVGEKYKGPNFASYGQPSFTFIPKAAEQHKAPGEAKASGPSAPQSPPPPYSELPAGQKDGNKGMGLLSKFRTPK
ncbi:hypothetical protein BC835DRAFT_1374604 [Cytidiella melzeri]|nr:hypothetical protein BC835DRAFT_1374604 [Cytidiella melzeri]